MLDGALASPRFVGIVMLSRSRLLSIDIESACCLFSNCPTEHVFRGHAELTNAIYCQLFNRAITEMYY
jgi:hypothetical protein